MTDGNGLAFPNSSQTTGSGELWLTKREWMATMITAGIVSNSTAKCDPVTVTRNALVFADCLIAELNKAEIDAAMAASRKHEVGPE